MTDNSGKITYIKKVDFFRVDKFGRSKMSAKTEEDALAEAVRHGRQPIRIDKVTTETIKHYGDE